MFLAKICIVASRPQCIFRQQTIFLVWCLLFMLESLATTGLHWVKIKVIRGWVCVWMWMCACVRVVLMSVTMMNLWWSDEDVSTHPIRLILGISCPHAPQDLRQLHAPAGGGGHDDHGQQARLQMCLYLRPVPGQPPAQIRDVHGSALWPLTCVRRSFNTASPFHSLPLVTSPDSTSISISTRRPAGQLTGLVRAARPRWRWGGGGCACVCVYRFDFYLCRQSWCF